MTVRNCIFLNNNSSSYFVKRPYQGSSGGISIGYNYQLVTLQLLHYININIANCTFTNNRAVPFEHLQVSLTEAHRRNAFIGRGGGLSVMIHAESTVNFTLVNSVFENNFADFLGGGGYILARDAFGLNQSYYFGNNIFNLNRANIGAGALLLAFDLFSSTHFIRNAVMYNCTFANNTAGITGGALYILPVFRWLTADSHIRIQNSKFYGNRAFLFGGAVNLFLAYTNFFVLHRQNISAVEFLNW